MKRGIRFSAWGGRKFVVAIWLSSLATILAFLQRFTPEMATLFSVIYAGFSYADAHISGKAVDAGVHKDYGKPSE